MVQTRQIQYTKFISERTTVDIDAWPQKVPDKYGAYYVISSKRRNGSKQSHAVNGNWMVILWHFVTHRQQNWDAILKQSFWLINALSSFHHIKQSVTHPHTVRCPYQRRFKQWHRHFRMFHCSLSVRLTRGFCMRSLFFGFFLAIVKSTIFTTNEFHRLSSL